MSPMPQFLKDMAKVVSKGEPLPGRRETRTEMGGFVKKAPDPGVFGNKRYLTMPKLKKELGKGPRQYPKKERFERAERLLSKEEMGAQISPWEVSRKIKTLKKVAKRPGISPTRKRGIKKDITFLQIIRGNKDEK